VVDPEILIVDEILSVGDIKFQEKSHAKMMEMIKGGTTVLYVSHSINNIKEICNTAIWLDHGQIVKIGDAKEICDEYYISQMGETPKETLERKKEETEKKERHKKK
jgi:ABC-type polysaccharide/polyol phosphate transport system ATPase subunit